MTSLETRTETAPTRLRTWAWVLLALTPIGLVLALVVCLVMLDALDVVSYPRDSFGAQFDPVGLWISLTVTGVVSLACPSGALACATLAVRRGDPRASTARTAAGIALLVCALLGGLPGLLVWGTALYFVLRKPRT